MDNNCRIISCKKVFVLDPNNRHIINTNNSKRVFVLKYKSQCYLFYSKHNRADYYLYVFNLIYQHLYLNLTCPPEDPEENCSDNKNNMVICEIVKECSICLDNLSKSEEKVLSCSHTFHSQCVDEWLEYQSSCPVCRQIQVNKRNEEGEDLLRFFHLLMGFEQSPLNTRVRSLNSPGLRSYVDGFFEF